MIDFDHGGCNFSMYHSAYTNYFYVPLIIAGLMLACEVAIAASHDPLANYCVTYVVAALVSQPSLT